MKKIAGKLKALPQMLDSRIDTHYHIGMRVVKTAVAVMLCLLVALLTNRRSAIPITAVSAIVTIRTTHGESISSGFFRILGTFIGGGLGLLAYVVRLFVPFYDDWLFVIIIPLLLMLDLYLCNVLKMQDSCSISCVVTVLVATPITLDATVNDAFVYTLLRLWDTFFGVVVGTITNLRPQQLTGLFNKNKPQAPEPRQ